MPQINRTHHTRTSILASLRTSPGCSIRSLIRPLLFILPALASVTAHAQQALPPAPARVVIETDNPTVTLYRIDGVKAIPSGRHLSMIATEDLGHVCRAPCGALVDPNFNYRIAGPGITPSEPVYFAEGSSVRLHVKAGSTSRRVNGVVLTTLGFGVSAAGGTLLGMGALVGSPQQQPVGEISPWQKTQMPPAMPNDSSAGIMKAGGIVLGVGVAMLATGIALWATSGTHVDSSIDQAAAVPLGGSARLTSSGIVF